MTYLGKVKNGVVVLEGEAALTEGTLVRVEPVEPETPSRASPDVPLKERLGRLAGKVTGLPSDLARNHDHYLYGRPRR